MKKVKILSTSVLFLFLAAFTPVESYKVGDVVADFKLKNIDGKMMSLADVPNAKGYIVVFTCNHCPFSVAYEDRIIALDKKYKPLGYPVVAINPNDVTKVPDDSYDNMIQRAKDKQFTFPYLHDETQEIAKAFGATRTPHVFILKRDNNRNTLKYIGAIDNNSDDASAVTSKFVEDAADALIAGKPVTATETKAIGCTIKWKQ